MKIHKFGNDYAYQQKLKSNETKVTPPVIVVAPPVPEVVTSQKQEIDDKDQIPTGGRSDMESSPEKEVFPSSESEAETNQAADPQEKKKGRTKKQEEETD